MKHRSSFAYTWEGAARRLERLAAANTKAETAWLRSLTLDESILIFEDLSSGIPELPPESELDAPPVVLSVLWRS